MFTICDVYRPTRRPIDIAYSKHRPVPLLELLELGLPRLLRRALSSTFVVKDLNKNERNVFQSSVNNICVYIAAKDTI